MFNLGRYFGIPLQLHFSAAVAVVVVGLIGFLTADSSAMATAAEQMIVLSLAFGVIVFHEYGHALVALSRGKSVHSITIWLLGGVAAINMDNQAANYSPRDEFWISVAGPAVNFVFFVFGLVALTITPDAGLISYGVKVFAAVNLILLLFNLLPAFPMDGGRILRSILVLMFNRDTANVWVSRVATVFGSAFIVFGVWQSSFLLPIIGVVVLYINNSERHNIN